MKYTIAKMAVKDLVGDNPDFKSFLIDNMNQELLRTQVAQLLDVPDQPFMILSHEMSEKEKDDIQGHVIEYRKTIDIQAITRCKDCKYYRVAHLDLSRSTIYCVEAHYSTGDTFFCADGEPKVFKEE